MYIDFGELTDGAVINGRGGSGGRDEAWWTGGAYVVRF